MGAHNRLPEHVARERCDELGLIFVGTYVKDYETRVQYICPKHSEHGVQESRWGKLRVAKRACRYCNGNGKTSATLQNELDERGIDVTITGEYINSKTPIEYICNTCGETHFAQPTNLLMGRGCPTCGRIKNTIERTKTTEEFAKELSEIQPNIEILGTYVNTHVAIKCRCNIDNFEWESYPANLLNLTAGCPICKCRISRGEKEIIRILDNYGIEYVRNKTFDDCKRISLLRFDFYIPHINTIIEYDGEQHFRDIPRFSGSGSFELTKERDEIKNKYCAEHGITMIRIPYYRYSELESIIAEIIKTDTETA